MAMRKRCYISESQCWGGTNRGGFPTLFPAAGFLGAPVDLLRVQDAGLREPLAMRQGSCFLKTCFCLLLKHLSHPPTHPIVVLEKLGGG